MIEYESGIEKNALFKCRHQVQDANIGWRINGTSIGQYLDITRGVVPENDSLVEILTIPALLEYNGTTVVCLAFFIDGSPPESTPAVTLTITGLLKLGKHFIIKVHVRANGFQLVDNVNLFLLYIVSMVPTTSESVLPDGT